MTSCKYSTLQLCQWSLASKSPKARNEAFHTSTDNCSCIIKLLCLCGSQSTDMLTSLQSRQILCNKYLSLLPDYVLGKFTVYECNEFKISLSCRVKSIYTGIHVYMPVAKNYIKLHSLLFEIHTVLYHMKKFCQHILVLKMIVCLQFKFSKLLILYFN